MLSESKLLSGTKKIRKSYFVFSFISLPKQLVIHRHFFNNNFFCCSSRFFPKRLISKVSIDKNWQAIPFFYGHNISMNHNDRKGTKRFSKLLPKKFLKFMLIKIEWYEILIFLFYSHDDKQL